MKPVGAAAEKKSRSKAFRLSPLQPRTIARGASSSNDAPDVAPLQLATDPVRIRDRGGLDTVVHTLIPEVGPDGCGRNTCEQICIRVLDTIPLLSCYLWAAYRAKLDAGAMATG